MKKRNPFIELVLILIIVVLLNLIFARLIVRIDISQGHKYTLSKSTRKIIRNLPDNIWIEFYASKNIPAHLVNMKKQIWDILNEYRIESKGKIHLREIDPMSNLDLRNRLYLYGIRAVNVNVYSKDKAEVVQTYLAVAIFYKDKVESIPVITNVNDLEYNLTSLILKITAVKVPVIGYPQGGAEYYLKNTSSILLGDLQKEYKVVPFDLTNPNEYDNLDLVIIPNYRKDMDKKAMYYLDQYILKGGKVAFFINGVNVDYSKNSKPNNSNIIEFLRSKHITVNYDIINDLSNNMIAFTYGTQQLIAPYPMFVKVMNKYMNPKFKFFRRIQDITLPWVSALNFSVGKDIGYDILLKSTEKAWESKGFILVDPTQTKPPKDKSLYRQFILCGIEKGKFTSYFDEKNLPDGVNKKDFIKEGKKRTELFVLGTSHILKDQILQRFPNDRIFLLNTIDYLIYGDKLSSIRNKVVQDPSIPLMSETVKTLIKWINYILMPLIVIIFGFIRFFKRKKKAVMEE